MTIVENYLAELDRPDYLSEYGSTIVLICTARELLKEIVKPSLKKYVDEATDYEVLYRIFNDKFPKNKDGDYSVFLNKLNEAFNTEFRPISELNLSTKGKDELYILETPLFRDNSITYLIESGNYHPDCRPAVINRLEREYDNAKNEYYNNPDSERHKSNMDQALNNLLSYKASGVESVINANDNQVNRIVQNKLEDEERQRQIIELEKELEEKRKKQEEANKELAKKQQEHKAAQDILNQIEREEGKNSANYRKQLEDITKIMSLIITLNTFIKTMSTTIPGIARTLNNLKRGAGSIGGNTITRIRQIFRSIATLPVLLKSVVTIKTGGIAIGVAAFILLAIMAGKRANYRYFSDYAKKCTGLKYKERTRCLKEAELESLKQRKSDLLRVLNSCSYTLNPSECIDRVRALIDTLDKQISKLEDQLKKL